VFRWDDVGSCHPLHPVMTVTAMWFVGLLAATANVVNVVAQPSPEVQERISQAIRDAADGGEIDYTAFVNPFVGTGEPPADLYSPLHAD
jgi:hypothetical protein